MVFARVGLFRVYCHLLFFKRKYRPHTLSSGIVHEGDIMGPRHMLIGFLVLLIDKPNSVHKELDLSPAQISLSLPEN
jgi:hypothetical protein